MVVRWKVQTLSAATSLDDDNDNHQLQYASIALLSNGSYDRHFAINFHGPCRQIFFGYGFRKCQDDDLHKRYLVKPLVCSSVQILLPRYDDIFAHGHINKRGLASSAYSPWSPRCHPSNLPMQGEIAAGVAVDVPS